MFENIFGCHYWKEAATSIEWTEARDVAQFLSASDSPSTTKNHLVQEVHSAEVEKPCRTVHSPHTVTRVILFKCKLDCITFMLKTIGIASAIRIKFKILH